MPGSLVKVPIERGLELEKAARDAVVYIIQSDLDGHSENLKELWEMVENDNELVLVNAELKRVIKALKSSLRP